MVTYTHRQIRKIDTAGFCRDMLCSKLYDCTMEDADEFAEMFDAEVGRVLDLHASLQTRRRRRGHHDTSQLSGEAKQAKLLRRRLTLAMSLIDAPVQPAWRLVTAPRDDEPTDQIKDQRDDVSGDVKSTWRSRGHHDTHRLESVACNAQDRLLSEAGRDVLQ